jgi:hypothetical protein
MEWGQSGGLIEASPALMSRFCGLGKEKKLSVLGLVITSALPSSLASSSAMECGLGEQLGAWCAEFGAGYNSSLNPNTASRPFY